MTEKPNSEVPTLTKLELREYSKKRDADYLATHGFLRDDSRQAIAKAALHSRKLGLDSGRYAEEDNRWILKNAAELAEHRSGQSQARQDELGREQEVLALQAALQAYETDIVKKAAALLRPKATRRRIETAQDELSVAKEEVRHAGNRRGYHEGQINDRQWRISELEEQAARHKAAKQRYKQEGLGRIDDYYVLLGRMWSYDQREIRERVELEQYKQLHGSVEENILERGHYLIHGVMPEFSNGFSNNRLVDHSSNWRDRMAYALLEQPTMSTSSFAASEDGPVRLWSDFGLALSGGIVEDASPGDAASVVNNDGSRSTTAKNVEDYQSRLAASLAAGSRQRYNEIITSHSRATAAFIHLDRLKDSREIPSGDESAVITKHTILWKKYYEGHENYRTITIGDVAMTAHDYRLPLIVFERGRGYLAQIDELTGVVTKGQFVSPEELAKWQWRPSEDFDMEAASDRVKGSVLAVV